jgi:6-phosphogluconate dehydrogenase
MLHNGIETGLLSTIYEAWGMLHKSLDLPNNEIGKIFERWNVESDFRNAYLLEISAEMCQRKKTPGEGDRGQGEGTEGYIFFWSVMEAANMHASAPTIDASQFFRVTSGDHGQRIRVTEKLKVPSL